MLHINHRINSVEQLSNVPRENGIELDIRYHNNDLVLHHDPYGHHEDRPTLFRDLLSCWKHDGPMILNVKTEGVERDCIALMQEFNIESWFFLDMSMPYFAIFAELAVKGEITGFGPENLAVRYSEREPIEYAQAFTGKAGWVWVDCFTEMPLSRETADDLQARGFRVCIVSPELQKHALERITEFRDTLSGYPIDAVCTKRPDLWGQGAVVELGSF